MELVQFTAMVPRSRLGDLMRVAAEMVDAESQPQPAPDEPAELRDWTGAANERDDARQVWSGLSDKAKALFTVLMNAPSTQFTNDELASQLDLGGRLAVAGVLTWPGRYCKAAGRGYVWRWVYVPAEDLTYYWMDKPVASLFRQVRDEVR